MREKAGNAATPAMAADCKRGAIVLDGGAQSPARTTVRPVLYQFRPAPYGERLTCYNRGQTAKGWPEVLISAG